MNATNSFGSGRLARVLPALGSTLLCAVLLTSTANAQSTDFGDIDAWFNSQFGNSWYGEEIGDLAEGALQTVTLPNRYAGWEFEILGETGSDPFAGDEFEVAALSHVHNDHAANDGLIARVFPPGYDAARVRELRFGSDIEAFDLDSIEIAYAIGDLSQGPGVSDESAQAVWIRGYSNGSEVHSQEVSGSVMMSGWQFTLGGPDGMIFNTVSPAGFTNIDEVRIEVVPFGGSNSAGNFTDYIALRDIQVSAATVPADPPTVVTSSPTSISTSSATLGGSVIDDGGASVTERGVVYSTAPNPTIDDNRIPIGAGTGAFSQSVTGLSPGTLYYVRAYATNSEGTAYGTQQSFTTLVSVSSIVRYNPVSALTNSDQVVYQVSFNGSVSGLSISNFSISSSGISGPSAAGISGSSSTYFVTVNTGAGDGTLRLNLDNSTGVTPAINNIPFMGQTYTIDKTPPTVVLSSSESSPTNASPIPVNIDFSEDVLGFSVGNITVSGGTLSNFSGTGANYTAEITPVGDGTITVDVPAGVAQDLAGNGNTAASQFSIVYDGTAPSVSISSSETSPTNASPIPVNIDFSEDVMGFSVGNIVVSGGTLSNFSGTGANYTADITPVGDGTITVEVPAGVTQDESGNGNQEGGFTIEFDGTAPQVVTLEAAFDPAPLNPGFTNVSVFELQLQFSEPIVDFDVETLIVENASVSLLDQDNQQHFTLGVTAANVADSAHTVTVEIPQGSFTDEAGNTLGNSETFAIEFGDIRPTAQFTTTATDPTVQEPIPVTLTVTEIFGQEVSGFDVSEIETENVAHIEWIGGTNPVFELAVTPEGFGNFQVSLRLPEGAVSDIAGNEIEASSLFTISVRQGIDPIPVPVAGPFGLLILAMLMFAIGARRWPAKPLT